MPCYAMLRYAMLIYVPARVLLVPRLRQPLEVRVGRKRAPRLGRQQRVHVGVQRRHAALGLASHSSIA